MIAYIADYWLMRGISLYLSAKVLLAIEVLRAGNVAVRLSADAHRLIHAKGFEATAR